MERGRGGAYDDVADGFRCGGVRGRGGGGYGRGRGGAGDDVANGGRGNGGRYGGDGGRRGRGHNGGGGRGYGRRRSREQPQRSDRQYWRPSGEPPAPVPEHQADQNLDARPGRSDQSSWRPSGQPSPAPEQQAAQNRGGQGWRPAPEVAPSTSTPVKIDAVVSGVQGLQISKPTPVSPSLSSEEKLVPMKRPDKGGERSFKTVGLSVNHFNVSYDPERTIMHYDVAVKRVDATKTTKSGKIMKSDLAAIRKKLCTDKPAEFPLLWTAYDGDKNIFSAVSLPTGGFRVEIPEEEGTRLRTYMVSIKLVNELKLCKLREYVTCELLSTPRDVLHGMDLVMKEKPSRSLLSVGRGFYPAEFAREDNLGQGSAAFRGFQHSLKLTSQGPALCLDYSVMAFHKRMSVIDFLQEKIWGFSLREFWRFKGQVENVLKGLKVTVTHRRTKQKYVIKGLTDKNAAEITFDAVDVDGLLPPMSLRLVDYFREKYQDIKYKDIPCLDMGKNGRRNDTPLEFCVLAEGQRYPKENLDRSAASKLKNMSLAAPRDRVSNILHMIKSEDGPCGDKIDENFGITVNKNMTKVIGRVLGPPELKLCAVGGKVTKVTVDREKCHWNLLGKSFVEGKSIARWAVIDFSSQDHRDRLDSNEFIPKLITRCNNLGMQMGEPCHFESCSMRPFRSVNLLREVLDKALKGGRGHLQLLVCAMSKKDPGYKYLKWICDTQIGIVTQCCLSRMASIASDQYLSNLALKINAKLGGSNVELIDRLPHFDGAGHVMFVGADVNHPAARNTTSPSIAAVVATINWPAVNRYAARVRSQHHRTESILNFGDMVLELVRSYYQINEVMPEKIVVFRDGVSEGQFDMVLNVELADLKRALGSINYYPTITVIVAQKRHSTRLFQENGPFNFSNVSPGTVVDTTIVHPFEFDFYLCSHYGSLGTSKPTHYYVLKDEHSFTSDQLQKLIYDLCYTFARCTKPVSLVPPVYYADLVAYRGRMYYEAMTEGFAPGSMISSSSASSSATFSVGSAEDRSYRLHPDLKDIMFFV